MPALCYNDTETRSYKEAMRSDHAPEQKAACYREVNPMERFKVWEDARLFRTVRMIV
jgi:hypothetical protein